MPWQRIRDNLRDIAADRQRGARELVLECARRIQADLAAASAVSLDTSERRRLARAVIAAQPDMAPFYHLAVTLVAVDEGQDVGSLADALGRWADRLERDPTPATAAELIEPGKVLVTYSRSGSVLAALAAAAEAGRSFALRLAESRPGYEGRTVARDAASLGIDVELLTDAALPSALRDVDLVLVGADAVGEAEFRNKVGTRSLCERAVEQAGTSVYVLADETKFLPSRYWTDSEPRDPSQVWAEPPAGVTVRNPYFEGIPFSAVTGVVCGTEILDAAGVEPRVAAAARALKRLNLSERDPA